MLTGDLRGWLCLATLTQDNDVYVISRSQSLSHCHRLCHCHMLLTVQVKGKGNNYIFDFNHYF